MATAASLYHLFFDEMESVRKYKKGETNEIAQTGMGREKLVEKNAISKRHQGQKKNNSIMLCQQKIFLQNQEITEQIKGNIKLSAGVTKIAGVFNSSFASISLRRSAAIRWQMQKVLEQINYLLALRS